MDVYIRWSVDTGAIRPLLERYLGNLTPGLPTDRDRLSPQERGKNQADIHIPYGHFTKKVYKGTENKATVQLVFSGDYSYSPENNIKLRALSEILQIKITQHLRENESEVYSPSVQVSYNKYPRSSYAFTVSFGCAPTNANHLIELVIKECTALRENGPAPEDLAKFKAEYKRTHELQLQDNEYWLRYLSNQYENNEDVLQVLGYNVRLQKLSVPELQAAAKKYLSGNNLIKFVLLPEK